MRVPGPRALLAGALIGLTVSPTLLFAHAGEDHGEAQSTAPVTVAGMQGDVLTSSSTTDYFEVVSKYPATVAGDDTRIRLFVADFATNRPIVGATLALSFKPGGVQIRDASKMISPGIYDVVVRFTDDTTYSMVATITAGQQTDFVELRNIYAGDAARQFLAEHATNVAVATGESSTPVYLIAAIAAGTLAVGILIVALLRRRRKAASESTAVRVSRRPTEPGRPGPPDSSRRASST
jgi:LPXTG-motif cell wall-anchored protein